ncbi:MAG TPA: Dabb family protein [Mycobacteriales bacterium]|nr:Dabb family protein [Mycobacteriales bacterium]
MVTHVVLMKFADRADAPEAKRRLESLAGQVPSLRTMRVTLDTLGLDGCSDLWLTTTHDSPAALRAYAEHPAHLEVLAWLRPRLAGRAAVDVEDGDGA